MLAHIYTVFESKSKVHILLDLQENPDGHFQNKLGGAPVRKFLGVETAQKETHRGGKRGWQQHTASKLMIKSKSTKRPTDDDHDYDGKSDASEDELRAVSSKPKEKKARKATGRPDEAADEEDDDAWEPTLPAMKRRTSRANIQRSSYSVDETLDEATAESDSDASDNIQVASKDRPTASRPFHEGVEHSDDESEPTRRTARRKSTTGWRASLADDAIDSSEDVLDTTRPASTAREGAGSLVPTSDEHDRPDHAAYEPPRKSSRTVRSSMTAWG
ncbi:hypothetical protein EJ03DRAFT_351305 [Teratosphaeria nubilosa]|uniref:Uncharacterized protein n=1 Tax=Teratosphaeria nubilosa TaxID=161662 RepID=A0A6G1L9T5_9PEZI|nr:hypothetical protein EJ03DRAFT_351305 [Teratosphaeria nubilosa]